MAVVAQFAVSLFAILALAWLVRRMGLGRNVRILDEEHAQTLAGEVLFGFEAQDTAVDEDGRAALLRDQSGTIILMKLHGAQFSGRVLGYDSAATISHSSAEKSLEVTSGERLFGKVLLKINAPEDWAQVINNTGNTMGEPVHA